MTKLFGTDGIRGRANQYPMTSDMALKIGKATALVLSNAKIRKKTVLIGKDTRLSSDMLICGLSAGLCAEGFEVALAGVIPTPGIAYLVRSLNAAAGIMVSASHNPYYDNGIKLFDSDGFKISDKTQTLIEALVLNDQFEESTSDPGMVTISPLDELDYQAFLQNLFPGRSPLTGIKLVLDCGHGATFRIAPALFQELGAQVISIGVSPDGKNINDNCGSEHTLMLEKQVLETQSDLGLAFDGDGDRLIAVDETGKRLSGDQILLICAMDMLMKNQLKTKAVVSTVMSNYGLTVALGELGITHYITDVGDRQVLKRMQETNASLGGEDSGHMIFLDHHTTGDGILCALKLLNAFIDAGQPLSQLGNRIRPYPQIKKNIDVHSKPDIETCPEILKAMHYAKEKLGEKGRVMVRYSGTQPMCRVLVEGEDANQAALLCQLIETAVRNTLGFQK